MISDINNNNLSFYCFARRISYLFLAFSIITIFYYIQQNHQYSSDIESYRSQLKIERNNNLQIDYQKNKITANALIIDEAFTPDKELPAKKRMRYGVNDTVGAEIANKESLERTLELKLSQPLLLEPVEPPILSKNKSIISLVMLSILTLMISTGEIKSTNILPIKIREPTKIKPVKNKSSNINKNQRTRIRDRHRRRTKEEKMKLHSEIIMLRYSGDHLKPLSRDKIKKELGVGSVTVNDAIVEFDEFLRVYEKVKKNITRPRDNGIKDF